IRRWSPCYSASPKASRSSCNRAARRATNSAEASLAAPPELVWHVDQANFLGSGQSLAPVLDDIGKGLGQPDLWVPTGGRFELGTVPDKHGYLDWPEKSGVLDQLDLTREQSRHLLGEGRDADRLARA